MKILATLILLSLPTPKFASSPKTPPEPVKLAAAHRGGQWYLAQSGHAVYCYGPVMLVPNNEIGLERVATFCKGERTMVPLKD